MLAEGQQVELTIEKVAAGGWTIGRHHGQVVLVRGAIPGGRATGWVERADRRVVYAGTRDVLERWPDRRPAAFDPLCGGSVFAHVAYDRQLSLKGAIVQDAFTRLARYPLAATPAVEASPEAGYRMRARLHVRGERVGFYREGTHQMCDAAPTAQLRPEALAAATSAAAVLHRHAPDAVTSLAISENIAAGERAVHVEVSARGAFAEAALADAADAAGLRGVSARTPGGAASTSGDPSVSDPLDRVTAGRVSGGELRRHAESFFQGNRFLLPSLVSAVLDAAASDGHIVDLYAGVGLFSIALAAAGHSDITAVEGDRTSGRDLRQNARAFASRVHAKTISVEQYLATAQGDVATIVVDPPRTGMSKEAVEGVLRAAPARIVYVSCDPPTLARDARRLRDGGYTLGGMRAFDLFPNTAHVETLAVFESRIPNP
jgi:tRNA/tmRNA/rRNA uracil-C5-methylase (TrmA/RlmC/RlmD family)